MAFGDADVRRRRPAPRTSAVFHAGITRRRAHLGNYLDRRGSRIMIQKQRANYSAAVAAALSLSLQPFVSTIAAAMLEEQSTAKPATTTAQPAPKPPVPQTPATSAAPATAKPAAQAAAPPPVDGGWPRVYTLGTGGSVLVYQPQISSWESQ